MAVISKCVIESMPSYRENGFTPPDITVTYFVCTNERTSASEVLQSAQQPSLVPGGGDVVPMRGQYYEYAIHTPPNSTQLNTNIFALDFYVQKAGQGDTNWRITVTYRAPRLGVDEEPGTFFTDSTGRNLAGNFWKQNGEAKRADERPPQAWVEYYDGQEEVQLAYDLGDGQSPVEDGDPKVLIANAAGQQIKPPVELPTLNETVIIEQHVTSGTAAYELNEKYKRTVNKSPIQLRPHILYNNNPAAPVYMTYPKYTLRFQRAEQTRAHQRGWGTYILQTRWEHNKDGWWERRQNVGDYYLDQSGNIKTFQDEEGQNIRPPCLLNFQGEWIKQPTSADNNNYVLNYLPYDVLEYAVNWQPTSYSQIEQWWGLS